MDDIISEMEANRTRFKTGEEEYIEDATPDPSLNFKGSPYDLECCMFNSRMDDYIASTAENRKRRSQRMLNNRMLLEFSKGEAHFITEVLEYYVKNLWSDDVDQWSEVDAHIEVAEKIITKFKETKLHQF